MRLTATDKAIGELNMRKADIERARDYIVAGDPNRADIATLDRVMADLKDIDRCVEILRSVAPAPKPEKVAKPRRERKSKKAEAES